MKKLHNILAVTAIALTFTACSSDNESTSNNEGKEYPISLSVGIGDLSVVTRAGSTQLTSGDLGLYIIKNGGKDLQGKYLCENSKFTGTTVDNVTTWSGQTYYWATDDAEIEYIAYMPFKDNGLEKTSISATENDYTIAWDVAPATTTGEGSTTITTDNTDPDLLWQTASAQNSASNHSVAITLGHACSKLTVNVSKLGSEIESTTEVSKIEINGMAATGTFKFTAAGEWSNLGVATTYAMNKWTTAADGAKYTFDAILIPQTATASLSITLSTGAVYQLAIPEQAYAMGKNYTITIQVGQDKVELGNITQTDWESVTGGDLTAQ